jgi:beta-N-acetylhexosaminidase
MCMHNSLAKILLSVVILPLHFSGGQTLISSSLDSEGRLWAARTLRHLSVEEKVGQILQIRVFGDYRDLNDPSFRFAVDQIHKYRIGSVDLGARMSGPNLVKGTVYQIATIVNELQRNSDVPLLVGADIERGLASRLSDVPEFPFPMAFGAINDSRLVEEFGAISAREARAVGIQWAFAPVADVNSNPANPIINVRSFGEDPTAVGKLVSAYIRGAHQHGMFVTVKHFPGHGDSSVDSHIGVVHIASDREHLEKYELPPFKMAIETGVDSVLLAHAEVPALDPGAHRIATTSPKIVDGLLRHELGFKGLVVTDALEMRGLMSLYPQDPNPSGRAAIEAIKAGVDVLMLPKDLDAVFNTIVAAIHSKEIPESRVDESVQRILEMKAAVGLNKSRLVDPNLLKVMFPDNDANDLAQHIADESVTLVRSEGHVIPVPAQEKRSDHAENQVQEGLVVVTFTDSAKSRLGHEFERQMKLRRPDAKIFHYYNDHFGSDAVPSEVISQVKAADRSIIAAFVTHVPGSQVMSRGKLATTVGLSGDSAQLVDQIVDAAPQRTIVVALGTPYLIQSYPKIQNYICTFSLTSTAEVSAVKALFGEIQNHAKLPVTLPGVAERGSFIPWPKRSESKRAAR